VRAHYSPDMARDSLMRELSGLVLGQVRDALQKRSGTQVGAPAEEPPVVAQLMIEIRSDGSRTIARGALNDLRSGESAQVHAEGRTPHALMMSLAGSLLALPSSFSQAFFRRSDKPELQSQSKVHATVTRIDPQHGKDPKPGSNGSDRSG
jgi:hypothetical protein